MKQTKTCRRCKRSRLVKFFPPHKRTSDGLCSWCRDCHTEAHRISTAKTPREVLVQRSKLSKIRNPLIARLSDWKRQGIDITKQDYLKLYSKQKGKCAICKKSENSLDRKLSVDHCHNKSFVRGLLCRKCNLLLGNVEDDISILRNAVKYLQKCKVKK